MIAELIDKVDNFERVRDEIAAILAVEVANQKALAVAAGKDPDNWDLRLYSERSIPWSILTEDGDTGAPVVNVWFDNLNFDESASNVVARQKANATYNIDCYGGGVSAETAEGHTSQDKAAALDAQRALRLVRNILMAGEYTYLGLRGMVWRRFVTTETVFQPSIGDQPAFGIVGARLTLQVQFNEYAPQVPAETLESLAVEVTRAADGAVLINADFDYS